MSVWKFKRFITDNGTNTIEKWMSGLPQSAAAAIDDRIRHLEVTEKWEPKSFRKLSGEKFKSLYEIKVKDIRAKIQYRVFGCFETGNIFILLNGASHKMNVYDPPKALDTAALLYKSFQKNKGNIDDYKY